MCATVVLRRNLTIKSKNSKSQKTSPTVHLLGQQGPVHARYRERGEFRTRRRRCESDALAVVSQANTTLTLARQAVKDARGTRRPFTKTSTAASARESERRCFLCRGPHLARDGPDRNKPTRRKGSKGSKGSKDSMKCKKYSGTGKGLGVLTMATAFTVSAKPEVEFVRSVARRRGFIESCDDWENTRWDRNTSVILRDREMRSVWFDVELMAEGGVHREASRDSPMSSHAGSSHSSTSRIPNRTPPRQYSRKRSKF